MKSYAFLCLFTAANLFAGSEESSVISYYDQEASMYDSGYSTALCLAENEIVMAMIAPLLGEKVLDVGCGTGILLDYLPVHDYLGIDISPGMIAFAKEKYPDRLFIVKEMEEAISQMPPDSFDSIVALFGPFSYSLRPAHLLREFYRVLKPGGTLILMPYTKRIENNFFLGEYNTSSEQSISKIFYDQKMLENLIRNSDFEIFRIKGINFFGNFTEAQDAIYRVQRTPEFYFDLLMKEQELTQLLPIEYARHCILIAKK